jgi:RecA/RadA recombinase
MAEHGIAGPWEASERVLACIDGSTASATVVRRAKRLADRLRAPLEVVNVATPETERAATGVPGLDYLLRGGLPFHRIHLIEGHPGAGKTTLGLQFLLEGVRRGESCMYITLSETVDELNANAKSHGWDLSGIHMQELQPAVFDHFIDLQGRIDAENISYISPRTGPAQVKAVYVTKGSNVKKGQLLLKLDDAIVRQNYAAAKQGLESIKTQLAYAKDIYQRQKNLWDQNIGTEVQLITAKNNVTTLENQLKSAEENVKVVQEQMNTSNVYSDVNGVANEVNIKMGAAERLKNDLIAGGVEFRETVSARRVGQTGLV